MKTIQLSPKKLDAAADEFFDNVKFYEENSTLKVDTTWCERQKILNQTQPNSYNV